ncbi:MAG TPA: hypothetical protein VIF10_08870 [Methylobacter sp.]|jgi:hypothetical protein
MTKRSLTNLKKRDRELAREESETALLKQFEGFFLFEFYVRYLKRSRNHAFNKLLKLKESIRQRFMDLQVVDMLAEYTICFEEFPENKGRLEIDLEGLVDWTLDAIQASDCQLFRLGSDFAYVSLSKEHLDQLFTPFREHEELIEPALKKLYYRFSDLTSLPNDILFVLEWWLEHLDENFRRQQILLGKLGLTSIEKNDWSENSNDEDVLCFCPPPFTAPQVLFFKKTNYELYDTNEAEVSINGQQLVHSIVLSLQFDQDAENIDEILREFVTGFYGAQATYFLNAIHSGTHPGFSLKGESKLVSSIRKAPNDNYCLIKRHDSISKWLSALVCYDAYRRGHESLSSVANDILMKHQHIKLSDADALVKYYYDIEKKINHVNELFRKKYPSEATRFHAG